MNLEALNNYFDEVEEEIRNPKPKPIPALLEPVEYRTEVLEDGRVVHTLVQ